MSAELCEYLEWDSRFFGLRIGRVTSKRLSEESLAASRAWAGEHALDCLYFLAEPDVDGMRVAERGGFRLVDIRVTLEAAAVAGGCWNGDGIRAAVPEDLPQLRAIAAASHRDSRFYQDGYFPPALCDELFRTWIEKSCNGYADAVLVAERQERAAGYLTCHGNAGRGQIGLVGVAPEARGAGLGAKLVEHGLRWFGAQGAACIEVVTQGRNVAAQRLYQKKGFLTRSVELWYHLWFSHPIQ